MRISVAYFAAAREAAGLERADLDVPEGATVDQVRALLLDRLPEAARPALASAAIARNRRYARPDEALEPGDEVAILPPVSGG